MEIKTNINELLKEISSKNGYSLAVILKEISSKNGYSLAVIEKDYYLTQILLELSVNPILDIVFKGGTCLNKYYLGYYRMSEDLDFIYNVDLSKSTNRSIKVKSESIRKLFYTLLTKLNLETSDELGLGWEKITDNKSKRILNLKIITKYKSIITERKERLIIEISFRGKLVLKPKNRKIIHLFYDAINNPILDSNKKIICIDLVENIAEKYRALITRKNIAVRDIFDIYYVLKFKKKLIQIDDSFIDLILKKIRESIPDYTKKKLIEYLRSIDPNKIDIQPIQVVLKQSLIDKSNKNILVSTEKMLKTIIKPIIK
ncbi:MAG: nucleotidyl transferase AbiEii/AbiGii toxin family protein [archaeon]